ncbi:MAG TPA: metalloregulator ArsR/SmtB family transcription factor [bacterium]|jgi:DNA-binding transcriptional ArsR family regulator
MVECSPVLDSVFGSLSDSTRRDILRRLVNRELSISEIAEPYDMSLAAISKHLKNMEKARLIYKRRDGKNIFVRLSPVAFRDASDFLKSYRQIWEERLDSLEKYLSEEQ